jgi:hypothetical protein
MAVELIQGAVLDQLRGATGLNSLKIQNHIYGCYVLMEDISQGKLSLDRGKLIGPKFSFDVTDRFAEIGIRFGFLTDTKLILDNCLPDYKAEWLLMFSELAHSHSVEKSDAVEDAVNEIIVQKVAPEDAFFLNAIETGMLPHDWLDKAISLLTGRALSPTGVTSSSTVDAPLSPSAAQEEEVPVEDTAITHAHTEKVIHHSTKRKALSTTRRHKEPDVAGVVPKKKWLNVTRRHHVSK